MTERREVHSREEASKMQSEGWRLVSSRGLSPKHPTDFFLERELQKDEAPKAQPSPKQNAPSKEGE